MNNFGEPKLVQLIRDCVQPFSQPAIYIGGGIDSTIILHHLSEKTSEKIHSYTFGFPKEQNEFEDAEKIADYYDTKHKEILIPNLLDTYPQILKHFHRPRFNLWIYWLAKKASEDKRQTCYTGEGADEHFGGYWYKPKSGYIEGWMGLFQWSLPTYQTIHNMLGLCLEVPYLNLDWRETYPYFDYEQHKIYLRQAYKGILPKFVLNKKKRPANRNYHLFWKQELHNFFPHDNPHSNAEIRELWNIWVTKEWLKHHMR